MARGDVFIAAVKRKFLFVVVGQMVYYGVGAV